MTANRAEKVFKEWLDKHRYPYIYVEQSPSTFAQFFRDEINACRPDFLIVIEGLGLIAVDVKGKDRAVYYVDKEKTAKIIIDTDDAQRAIKFERIFRIPFWFAVSGQDSGYSMWYWISASMVLEASDYEGKSSKDGKKYYAVPLHYCRTIDISRDGLERIIL